MGTGSADRIDVAGLVRFLLARLDDDTAETRKLLRSHAQDPDIARLAARRGADVDAKRQVIGALQQQLALRDLPHEQPVRTQAIGMLRALARPYADHPGYRSEWA
jgi:hypothetical protein